MNWKQLQGVAVLNSLNWLKVSSIAQKEKARGSV